MIESDGVSAARTIFSAWLQLFGTVGNALTLSVGTAPLTKTLSFKKNNVMLVLSTLVQFSQEIARGTNVIYCSDVPDYEGQKQVAFEPQVMIPATVGK